MTMPGLSQGWSAKQPPHGLGSSLRHPTSRIAIIIATIVLLFTSLFLPAPAAAWGGVNPINDSTITWCEVGHYPFSTQTARNTINNAIESWDANMPGTTITKGTANCQFTVGWRPFSQPSWPSIPATTITGRAVWFNFDFISDYWVYGANQQCVVRCPMESDLWTIALHEVGHALGFSHNMTNPGTCYTGSWSYQAYNACSNQWYTLAVMYNDAADGYRRWISGDDRGAIDLAGY